VQIYKTKLNTKSSTEAEVADSSDYLPNTIWAKMFLAEQGYELTKKVFYQDNQSAIRIEKNGRASCGQNTLKKSVLPPSKERVENPILEKV
jgi:hypothetical protein